MITGDTTLTLTALLALVTVACTIFNTFHGKSKDDESTVERRIQEAATRAEEMTKINVKLDSIGADVRYMREENASTKKAVQEIHTEVELLKASLRSAHKRMDAAGIGRADYNVERKGYYEQRNTGDDQRNPD